MATTIYYNYKKVPQVRHGSKNTRGFTPGSTPYVCLYLDRIEALEVNLEELRENALLKNEEITLINQNLDYSPVTQDFQAAEMLRVMVNGNVRYIQLYEMVVANL
jgi:hypothetical protein